MTDEKTTDNQNNIPGAWPAMTEKRTIDAQNPLESWPQNSLVLVLQVCTLYLTTLIMMVICYWVFYGNSGSSWLRDCLEFLGVLMTIVGWSCLCVAGFTCLTFRADSRKRAEAFNTWAV